MPRKPKLDDRLLQMQEHTGSAIIDKIRTKKWSQWNLEGESRGSLQSMLRKADRWLGSMSVYICSSCQSHIRRTDSIYPSSGGRMLAERGSNTQEF